MKNKGCKSGCAKYGCLGIVISVIAAIIGTAIILVSSDED